MKKLFILSALLTMCVVPLFAQDDMYFVPTKKNIAKEMEAYRQQMESNYGDSYFDVDDYNRYGSYITPIDSAGHDIINFSMERGIYPDSAYHADNYTYSRRMSRFDDYVPSTTSYWAGYRDGYSMGSWYYPWYDSWYYDRWYYDPWYYGYYSSWYSPWYYRPYYYHRLSYGWHSPIYVHPSRNYARNGHRIYNSGSSRFGSRSYSSGLSRFGSRSTNYSSGRGSSYSSGSSSFGARSSGSFSSPSTRSSSSFGSSRSSGSFGSRSGGSSGGGARSGGSFGGRR